MIIMRAPKNCKKCGGQMQAGGTIDLSAYLKNPILQESDVILGVNAPMPEETQQQPIDPMQDAISKGILEAPKGWNSAQEAYDYVNKPEKRTPATPSNWKQNLGIGLMGLTSLGSEISGRVARSRQNQYDYQQQASSGMLNPMPTTDYQPNPYSLYAKYGGKLKDYKYGGLQHADYFGPPFSNGATYKFSDGEQYDKTAVAKKLIPELFELYGKKKRYQVGGRLPSGSALIGDHKVTYPGDTLTSNQIENAYEQYRSQLGNYGNDNQSHNVPIGRRQYKNLPVIAGKDEQGKPYYYQPSSKDSVKIHKFNEPFLTGLGEAFNINSHNYLPAPNTAQAMGNVLSSIKLPMKKGGKWIPNDLKKGRCTPAPNPDCPEGSPQYNLAMTFKKHHGFHKKK